jgi:hypothetical protein
MTFQGSGVSRLTLRAAFGIDEYGTAEGLPGGEIAVTRRTSLTVNAGGGIRVPIVKDWGLRTDARWFNGTSRTAPEHWRIYNGVTFGAGRR